MASSKVKKPEGNKAKKPDPNESLSKIKDGRVNKYKEDKAASSGSESDNESDISRSGSESAASSASEGSDRESDDEVSNPSRSVKVNGKTKSNGVNANKASDDGSGSGSESDGDHGASSSSDSKSGSDHEGSISKKVSKPAVARGTKVSNGKGNSSDSERESDEASAKGAKSSTSAKLQSTASDASSDNDSDSSSSDEDKDAVAQRDDREVSKKRKADEVETPVMKKTRTESAISKTLFVGNLSWNVDEDWLKSEFQGFGEVISCRIMTHQDSGKSKGFGFVDFGSEDEANKAVDSMNGFYLDGRPIKVDLTTTRDKNDTPNRRESHSNRANRFGDVKSQPSDTLFIGNISWSATAEQMQEAFAEHGNVTRVALPTDKETGELKGFGYVSFSSVDEAQAAIDALNGAYVAGRNIRLDFATPRSDDRGGFRGGRGGGDRGGMADRPGKWERGGFGGGRGGGWRGDSRGGRGRGAPRGGGRGGSFNRGGVGDFSGKKTTF